MDDEIFALGVCRLSVIAMNALKPKEGFSAGVSGVSGVILRCVGELVFEKPAPTRRESGDDDPMALSRARAGRYTLCRHASDYAKIGHCLTAEALRAASAPSTRRPGPWI